jgi:hypothetical protein
MFDYDYHNPNPISSKIFIFCEPREKTRPRHRADAGVRTTFLTRQGAGNGPITNLELCVSSFSDKHLAVTRHHNSTE